MTKEFINITEEKLNELNSKTKDNFTKKLIEDLRKQINSNESEFIKQLNFQRILEIVNHEDKRNRLKEFKSSKYKDIAYGLAISLRNKKIKLSLNGEFRLSEVSDIIQKEFNLEPFHLYEFEIGNYKFGPECDEWQEIFDSLDGFKLGAAISAAGLSNGGKFKFLYDFGDRIRFNIEIINIKKLNLKVQNE
jgi:hypothetical protein